MGYLSEKGKLAGPIQINGNSVNDNNVLWLKSKYRSIDSKQGEVVLHVCNVNDNFLPIYASMPRGVTDWTKFDNAVATVGWVRNNFTSFTGVGGFNPDDYVKSTDFDDLQLEVISNKNRIVILESKASELNSIKNRVSALENNPYPDGVIFVAGTAAEVV